MNSSFSSALPTKTIQTNKGWATICKSDDDEFYIGYFLSQSYGLFKLLLKPSKNAPLYHDCCCPETENGEKEKNEFLSIIPNRKEEDSLKSFCTFFDLSLKQDDQIILVENCQLAQPGSDVLNVSTSWSDDILGRHEENTGAVFQSHRVKVGKDASLAVDKYFPAFKGKECVINIGELDVHYECTFD